ncbi:MAG: NAD(P)H-hydrate epimerase, partial [Bacteroidota bacterium]
MQFILNPDEMRKADATAIEKHFIPSLVLMENAARSAAEIIIEIFAENGIYEPDVCIICGSGNNGGDGFAIARHLFELCNVRILWIGSTSRMSPETEVNFRSAKSLGINIKNIKESDDLLNSDFFADCIVDAMIGVGGSEDVKGVTQYVLAALKDRAS